MYPYFLPLVFFFFKGSDLSGGNLSTRLYSARLCRSAGRFLSATSQNPRGRKSRLPLFSVTDLAAIPPQSGLCGLPLSVVSLVLLIWASCWDHGLLILRTKRRLIELVKPEAVSVLIRRHLTSLEDLGGAWQNSLSIGLLSRSLVSELMPEKQMRHISVNSVHKQYRRSIGGELQADSHLSYLFLS